MLSIVRRAARSKARGSDPNARTEYRVLRARAILENPPELTPNVRRARIDAYLLSHYSVAILPDSLLAGTVNVDYQASADDEDAVSRADEVMKTVGVLGGFTTGQTGHRVVDYELLLTKGLSGVLAEVEAADAALKVSDPDWAARRAVYESMRIDLTAVRDFAVRTRETLRALAAGTQNPEERARLTGMAEGFAHAPEYPARSFRDAIQAMWFLQFCLYLCDDTSLTGRLDNYLYPYYKRDTEAGILTPDEAFALIEELYLRHNELYDAWPASLMVCGVDRDGVPIANELSRMCLRAIEMTGLVNPSVAVSYTDDTPEDILDLAVESIVKGYTRPSIFNDRVIREGLRDAGMDERDARYYIHSTCVEITPIGCSGVEVATPYINLNKAFEFILGEGSAFYGAPCGVERLTAKPVADYTDFEIFYADFRDVCAEIIRTNLTRVIDRLNATARYTSCPLSSAFINDCIARGVDAAAGGTRYRYVYPCFPGFINLIDGLAAIKIAVFDEKRLTLPQIAAACRENYTTTEDIRRFLRDRLPKFGNDQDAADRFGIEMFDFLRKELARYSTATGATFHPSYFAWVMHGRLGEVAGATPDGRLQGTALSEHLGAVQGNDREGPTAVMRSVAKLPAKYAIGGVATNFRFSEDFACSEKGRAAIKTLIKVCMQSGCFEVQFNVVGQQTLLDAKKNPDKHRTLLVRVAGYSDYFVNLLPVIQDEIIKRTEYGSL